MGPLSYTPSKEIRTSLLSGESPEQNYRGLFNLAVLLLVVNNIRIIIDNFFKYGWLVSV
jgi:diacylglycerol O-acyltransferase-1